jgi:hypothetical protein
MKSKKPGLGEIAPAHVLQAAYGLYAANRPPTRVDRAEVPEHLQDLIPFAEQWGIGDDILRSDALKVASAADKARLLRAIDVSRRAELWTWIETCGDAKDWTETVRAFFWLRKAAEDAQPVTRARCSDGDCEARVNVEDAPRLGWHVPPWLCPECFANPARRETWEREWHLPYVQRLGRTCEANHASCTVRVED